MGKIQPYLVGSDIQVLNLKSNFKIFKIGVPRLKLGVVEIGEMEDVEHLVV